jgi:hypothetical protein
MRPSSGKAVGVACLATLLAVLGAAPAWAQFHSSPSPSPAPAPTIQPNIVPPTIESPIDQRPAPDTVTPVLRRRTAAPRPISSLQGLPGYDPKKDESFKSDQVEFIVDTSGYFSACGLCVVAVVTLSDGQHLLTSNQVSSGASCPTCGNSPGTIAQINGPGAGGPPTTPVASLPPTPATPPTPTRPTTPIVTPKTPTTPTTPTTPIVTPKTPTPGTGTAGGTKPKPVVAPGCNAACQEKMGKLWDEMVAEKRQIEADEAKEQGKIIATSIVGAFGTVLGVMVGGTAGTVIATFYGGISIATGLAFSGGEIDPMGVVKLGLGIVLPGGASVATEATKVVVIEGGGYFF